MTMRTRDYRKLIKRKDEFETEEDRLKYLKQIKNELAEQYVEMGNGKYYELDVAMALTHIEIEEHYAHRNRRASKE